MHREKDSTLYMNFLHNHYYTESKHQNKMKLKPPGHYKTLLRTIETPEPLKVEKYKLSPITRAHTLKKRNKLRSNEIKQIPKEKLILSESFNKYIEKHALTNISPVEIINHYSIEAVESDKKKSEIVVAKKSIASELQRTTIVCDFSLKDLSKLNDELFRTSEKKKRPIIKFGKKIDKKFVIVGNMLNLNGRNSVSREGRRGAKSARLGKDVRSIRVTDVTLKSPGLLLSSIESLSIAT